MPIALCLLIIFYQLFSIFFFLFALCLLTIFYQLFSIFFFLLANCLLTIFYQLYSINYFLYSISYLLIDYYPLLKPSNISSPHRLPITEYLFNNQPQTQYLQPLIDLKKIYLKMFISCLVLGYSSMPRVMRYTVFNIRVTARYAWQTSDVTF